MTAESYQNPLNGIMGDSPRMIKLVTTDSFATVTAAGWLVATPWYAAALANGFVLSASDVFFIAYGATSASSGMFTLGASNILVPSSAVGGVANAANSAAAAGTVTAFSGKVSSTVSVMTSGALTGLKGETDMVGASGGTAYGVLGTVVPTGTLSSTEIVAAVAGVLNLAGATINVGTVAGLYANWGVAAAVATDLTKCHGVMFENTSVNKLNSLVYLGGNATYLLELPVGTTDYEVAAGTGAGSAGNATHCAAQEVLAFRHNGATKYIAVFTQNT